MNELTLMEKMGELESGIISMSLISIAALFIAIKKGFFNWEPSARKLPNLRLKELITAFFLFLSLQLLVGPAVFAIILRVLYGADIDYTKALANSFNLGWFNLSAICGGVIGVLIALFSLKEEKRELIIGEAPFSLKDIGLGIVGWLIGFPLAVLASQLAALFVLIQFHHISIDQSAVKNLKMLLPYPFLFGLTLFTIVFLVPLAEELLFRGYFQSYLRDKMGAIAAIVLTSIFFALFHVTSSQSWSNFEIVSALFVLSLFLGFLYERQRSLWASYALHSCFNAISAIMIFATNL